MKDIFINELERFSYFSAYYLFLYEQSILDPNFAIFISSSKELFLIYLKWKYTRVMMINLLNLYLILWKKIQDVDFLSINSSYIKG